jgi:hypothetical protein
VVRANVNAIAPCDPQYIEALGLAVHNFAWLEYHVIWVIEELEPNYWEAYASKAKTAGALADDFDRVIKEHAKGHAIEAELRDVSNEFPRLKYFRDKLLHAIPMTGSDGRRLHHLTRDIAWSLDRVRQAATEFATGAESAQAVFQKLCGRPATRVNPALGSAGGCAGPSPMQTA